MPYLASNVPDHVPEDKAEQWASTFNAVLAETGKEDQAFAAANALLSENKALGMVKAIGGAIKAVDDETYEGIGIFFTDPDDPDLEDDFFDHKTNLWLEDVETKAVLYDHTMGIHPKQVKSDGEVDEDLELPPHLYRIGKVTKRWLAPDGLHFQFKLTPTISRYDEQLKRWDEVVDDEHEQWLRYIKKKLGENKFNFSTDSVEHIVRRTYIPTKGVNHIDEWPPVFISITPKAAHGKAKTITKVSPASAAVRATAAAVDQFLSSQKAELVRAERVDDAEQVPNELETSMKKIKISPDTLNKVVRGMVEDNWKSLEAHDFELAVKAATMVEEEDDEEVKAEGEATEVSPAESSPSDQVEGELMAKIRPIAEQLVALYGGTLESAIAMIMQCGMTIQQEHMGATAPAEEVAADATANMDMMDEEAYANFDEDDEEAYANFDDEDEDEAAFASLEDEEDEEAAGGAVTKYVNRAAVRAALRGYNPGGIVTKNIYINKGAQPKSSLTRFIRGIVTPDPAAKAWTYKQSRMASKALGLNPDSAGGYIAPVEQSTELIKLLREQAIMLGLVTNMPMNRETLIIPKQTGGATTRWVGENSTIAASQQTFGAITLVSKKLACLVQVSNELLMDSDPDVDAFIRNDISEAMALEVDRVIIDGDGNANEPRGVINAGITSTPSSTPTSYADLVNIVKRVEQAKVAKTGKWSWLMNAGGKAILRQMKDGADQYIWTGTDGIGQQVAGALPTRLLDYDWKQTETFVDGGDSKPRLLFGNWSDVIVGMRKTIEIRATDVAGTSFEDDQTWIRAIIRMDVGIRYPESLELLTALALS